MDRRRFIKGSMAMAAVCGTSGIASLFLRRHSRQILILPTANPTF
ncbi:twin-arginine translocation signal domain-containing protein [Escherichia coli]